MTSQMITYVQKKYWVWKAFQGTHTYTHNTLESLHIYYMGNKSNYLIIIHHLRSFENYAFVVDTHNDVHISSFHFVHREELAMKIGLTEARIQVSFFSILLWAPYHTMYITIVYNTLTLVLHQSMLCTMGHFWSKRIKMLAPIFGSFWNDRNLAHSFWFLMTQWLTVQYLSCLTEN